MSDLAHATLMPAYGRDYNSKDGVIADLKKGRDFIFVCLGHQDDGRYCSIRDGEAGDKLRIRYAQSRKVCLYTITEDDVK